MKSREKGFTIIELIIAVSIMILVAGAAGPAIFQIFRNTERNSNYMTAVRQVQNAGHWISRDAQMALVVTTDNLTLPDLLTLTWTEWDEEDPIYHTANYYFDNLNGNIGQLKRHYWSTEGADEQTLIAQYIYCNPADSANTTQVSFQDELLTVQLTALFRESQETREYRITHREEY
ncbi:type II secretion system protein J [Chloroflexota bacterium]